MEIKDDSGGGVAVDSPKGVCLFHGQSGMGAASYSVTNVVYFGLDQNGLVVTNEGTDAAVVLSDQLGQLAYMMYERYNSGTDDITGGDYVGSMIFSMINDGYLGVDSSFFQNNVNVSYAKNPSSGAVSYGSNAYAFKGITVNNLDNTKIVSHDSATGDTILGPFSVSYGARGVDNIVLTPMNADDTPRKANTDDKGSISWSTDMQTWNDGSTMSDATNGIKSNTSFYIKVSDTYQEYNGASKIKIDYIQQGMQYIRAKLVFAKSYGYDQQIAFFAADQQTYTGTATQTIGVTPSTPLDLTVVKSGDNNVAQANVSFNLLNGVAGQAHAHWGSKTEENGVNIYSDITFKEWTNEENQIFTTGSSGKFIVKGLDPSYTYSLQETSNPNSGYTNVDIKGATLSNGTASVQLSNTDANNNSTKNQVTNIKLSSTQGNELYIVDRNQESKDFNINITKTDLSGNSNVDGAEFRIKVYDGNNVLGWLRRTNGEYEYDASYKNSTIWSTDNGKVSITGLSRDYRYQIYETKQATGYIELRFQIANGMKVKVEDNEMSETRFIEAASSSTESNDYAATDDSIYCTTVSYSGNGTDVDISISNYKRRPDKPDEPEDEGVPIKISGFIWIDKEVGKNYINNVYDSNSEELYKGTVKISLINSDGETVKTVTTDSGNYTMDTGIEIPEDASKETVANRLEGYYLKFEYDNSYSTVAPMFNEQNGSKALINDKDGEAYIYNLNDFVEQFYNDDYTLQYMNLGIIEIPTADYTVNQTIAYVKVVINGYTYTYEYAGTGEVASTAAPTVEFSNGNAYERPIYPSDIAYSVGRWSDSNSLKVYVVYRIDITNSNTTNYTVDRDTINERIDYVEVNMNLTNLVNNYDKDTYVLETDYDSSENSDFANWKDDNNQGIATYTGDKLNNPILPNRTRTIYNQYRVKDEALEELLNTEERAERVMTTAKTTAYHNYWKAYYTWSSDGTEAVLRTADRQTSSLEKEAKAYYLKLKLSTERTITGMVFKDENIYGATGEVIGSGFFDGNESKVNNVKVELITEDGNQAVLYNKANNYANISAQTQSNTDGTYSLVGVTPGKYYIRFTYGDGTQKLCTLNSDGTYSETDQTVSLADYKSTIISESWIKAALGYDDANFKFENETDKENWYKKLNGTNYNVAVDNLEQRAEYNENNTSRNNISADSALTSVTVENTTGDYVVITKEENGTKETISGMNLGLIEIPKIELAFEKVVSNIQITNSQGNILADGNPASQNLASISNLDFDTHLVDGSNFVRAEINEQELYGSTLRLEYSITVQNNSQVNYYEDEGNENYGYYYKFGEYSNSNSKEVTVTVDEVLDFLDPSIVYENVDTEHKIEPVSASSYQELTNNIQSQTGLTYEILLKITRNTSTPIYTTKHTEVDGERVYSQDETQKTAIFTASKLLSADQDDLGVVNVALVSKLHVTDNPKLVETIYTPDPDDALVEFQNTRYFGAYNPTQEVSVIITPPTGTDIKSNIVLYTSIGIVALFALTGGIILIKKKVLHK